jgi:O-antigen/teichoic acid export membrane protein
MLVISLASPRATYWFKVLSKFISVQLLIQVIGIVCGILLIRTLSKQQYAYFVLANSMQGTMNVLADSGIGSALLAIGGKVYQDSHRFGQLINTALYWRRYLAVIAMVFVVPILLWMLSKNGASLKYSLILTIGILIELHFYLNIGVVRVIPLLHSQIDRLQNIDLILAGSRLIMILVASVTFINAAIGILISAIASTLGSSILWHWIKNTIDVKAPINHEDSKEITKLVKSQSFNAIFFCFQGQLTVWLISIFGNVENVAEIGALSRLAVIFTILNSITNNIVVPNFSKCHSKIVLLNKYKKVVVLYFAISIFIFIIVYIFSPYMILILGKKYSELSQELWLMFLSSIVIFINSSVWSLNVSKGWVQQSWLNIPCTIMTQIVLLAFLDLSNISAVICFGGLSIIPSLIINFYMSYLGLNQLKRPA